MRVPSGAPAPNASGPRRWTDHEVDLVIGRLLQIGVAIAAAVVLAGSVMLLAHHGHDVVTHSVFRGASGPLTSVGAIVQAAMTGDALAVIQVGLVLLIATPIARVALTLVAFVVQKDWLYTGLTGVVLGILLVGLLG
jgi:uncharacterized membrane protein